MKIMFEISTEELLDIVALSQTLKDSKKKENKNDDLFHKILAFGLMDLLNNEPEDNNNSGFPFKVIDGAKYFGSNKKNDPESE